MRGARGIGVSLGSENVNRCPEVPPSVLPAVTACLLISGQETQHLNLITCQLHRAVRRATVFFRDTEDSVCCQFRQGAGGSPKPAGNAQTLAGYPTTQLNSDSTWR